MPENPVLITKGCFLGVRHVCRSNDVFYVGRILLDIFNGANGCFQLSGILVNAYLVDKSVQNVLTHPALTCSALDDV